jgi:hypothetical protein
MKFLIIDILNSGPDSKELFRRVKPYVNGYGYEQFIKNIRDYVEMNARYMKRYRKVHINELLSDEGVQLDIMRYVVSTICNVSIDRVKTMKEIVQFFEEIQPTYSRGTHIGGETSNGERREES